MIDKGDGRPVIVGLTGNIGTGKSTVAAMLTGLGADVIDADKVAHEVMRPVRGYTPASWMSLDQAS